MGISFDKIFESVWDSWSNNGVLYALSLAILLACVRKGFSSRDVNAGCGKIVRGGVAHGHVIRRSTARR